MNRPAGSNAPSGLTRAFALNTVSTVAVYGVYLVVTFLANKLLVGLLGAVAFGAWQVCVRLLSYVTPGDGPISQALKWVVAHRRDRADGPELRRAVGSALILWAWLAVVMVAVGALLTWQAPALVRDLPADLVDPVRLACAVLVVRMIVASGGKILVAPVQGLNLTYRTTWVEAGLEILRGAVTVVAAWLGYGLAGLAGGLLAAATASVVAYGVLARRLVPWFGVARPRRDDFAVFSRFGGWLLASNVLFRLLLMSDFVLLGWAVGGGAVTVLTFTQQVCNFGVYIVVLLASAFTPGLGQLVGAGERERATQARQEMLAVAWLLTLVVGSGVVLWNRPFVRAWVGDALFGGPTANLLVVLVFLQTAFIRLDGMIIDATLQMRTKVAWSAVATVVAVVLALVLGRARGLEGLLVGLLVGRGVAGAAYPLLVRRVLGPGRGARWLPWRAGAVTAVVLAAATVAAGRTAGAALPLLLIGAPATALVTGLLGWFLGLDAEMRARLGGRLAALRGRR